MDGYEMELMQHYTNVTDAQLKTNKYHHWAFTVWEERWPKAQAHIANKEFRVAAFSGREKASKTNNAPTTMDMYTLTRDKSRLHLQKISSG